MVDDDVGETIMFPPAYSGDTVFGATWQAQYVFDDIVHRHSRREAQRIFRDCITGKMSKRRAQQWDNWKLLARLDAMAKPVPYALAKTVAGPKAKPEAVAALHKKVLRAVEARKRKQKAGTWRGPGGPGGAAGLITIRTLKPT